MEIILPKKKNSQDEIKIDSKSIVIIGANGSGKTRFSTNIEKKYDTNTHRISAQKSLTMPDSIVPTSKRKAEALFLYGLDNPNYKEQKNKWRWGSNPNTHLLDDFKALMVFLYTDEYEESIKFKDSYTNGQNIEKPITKLDKVQEVFEYVIPHRKLIKKSGTIETYPTGKDEQKYNASEMSDGERIIFYLIGEVVCTKKNSIVVVDEPENHLHKSIIKRLWDRIEQLRPDCTFIYLTHDIDFAVSREKSQKIWMKEYLGNDEWDYELLNENMPLPEQLYLEVLGSRKPILFIEGDTDSIDYKLYSEIFKEYTVKPLDSCQKVFESTSSFNSLKDFHHIESFGIIDRDRRTDNQIASISRENIWVSKVAEVENFLLLEDVIKIVAKNMRCENIDELISKVKSNVFKSFENKLEEELTQRVIHIIKDNFEKKLNPKVKTFNNFSTEIQDYWSSQDFDKIYQDLKSEYQNIIESKDYNRVLEIFNNKGLLYESKVVEECRINTKNNSYLKFVISILKENNADSQIIRNTIESMIIK